MCMDNDIFFKWLEKAAKRGLNDSFDISKDFQNYLRKNGLAKGKPTNWYELPDLFLGEYKRLGYIHYIPFYTAAPEELAKQPVPDNWVDLIQVSFMIKPEGLIFLYEKRKIDQQAKTNNLTVWFIFVTLFIGLCNLYFAWKAVSLTKESITYKADTASFNTRMRQQSIRINKLQHDSVQIHPKQNNILLTDKKK